LNQVFLNSLNFLIIIGMLVYITGGNNIGRVGEMTHRERHAGSFDIIHVKDARGKTFATRIGNVFVIGEPNNED
jgi:small subunit ribosomal protein S4e